MLEFDVSCAMAPPGILMLAVVAMVAGKPGWELHAGVDDAGIQPKNAGNSEYINII